MSYKRNGRDHKRNGGYEPPIGSTEMQINEDYYWRTCWQCRLGLHCDGLVCMCNLQCKARWHL